MRRKNLLLWPSIRHFHISTMFYALTTINSTHYVDSIYPNELEIKDTQCSTSASYLDTLLKVDINGKLTTKLYDKRDDFNFSIVHFPFLCSNIPISPAQVFISRNWLDMQELVRHTMFIIQRSLLTKKLISQGFLPMSFTSNFSKFYYHYNNLVCQ
jgi:hypothetical protein